MEPRYRILIENGKLLNPRMRWLMAHKELFDSKMWARLSRHHCRHCAQRGLNRPSREHQFN